MNHDVVPEHPDKRSAPDQTFEHIAACDRTDFGDLEDLPDFHQADDAFFFLGREHSRQRGFHLVHRFVDDVVVTKIYAVRPDQFPRSRIGTGVEPDNDCIGCQGKVDVRFRNCADARMNDIDLDLCRGKLFQRLRQGFI